MDTSNIESSETTPDQEMTFAQRLKKAMDAKTMSQAELGRRINRKRGTVNNWLSGEIKMPNAAAASAVAKALGVRYDWLATGVLPMRDAESESHANAPAITDGSAPPFDVEFLIRILDLLERATIAAGKTPRSHALIRAAARAYPLWIERNFSDEEFVRHYSELFESVG